MNKENKKYAIAVSVMLTVGAIVAALPILVEAAVSVSDSGTAEPMYFPNITQDTGTQVVNATSYLTITNSGDTINGNITDEVAGNKWIRINITDNDIFHNTSNNENLTLSMVTVYYRIDSGSWYSAGDWGMMGDTYIDICDSYGDAYDYTFSSGSTMDIKLECQFLTNGRTAGTYSTTQKAGSSGMTWKVMGYS